MSAPLQLSIAMCTYNGARYLRKQLASITSQTLLPEELVVCDDGSTDDTPSLLESFAAHANFPVRIEINSERLGSTQNFAKAISLCSGDIIVLADQDDIWHSDKLACTESEFLSKPELGGLFSNALLIDAIDQSLPDSLWSNVGFTSSRQQMLRDGEALDLLLIGNFVTGATLSFRAVLKNILLPIPSDWVHDYWIALLLAGASNLGCTDRPLIKYRCHPAQQLGLHNSGHQNIAGFWRRFVEFDAGDYLVAIKRCEDISEHLRQYDAIRFAASIAKCEAVAEHLHRRSDLSKHKLRRYLGILKETVNGNYFRHSSGLKSILRDLLARY